MKSFRTKISNEGSMETCLEKVVSDVKTKFVVSDFEGLKK